MDCLEADIPCLRQKTTDEIQKAAWNFGSGTPPMPFLFPFIDAVPFLTVFFSLFVFVPFFDRGCVYI